MSGGGAVAVLVQASARTCSRAVCSSLRTRSFSWASTTARVGFDRLQGAARDPAQLVGVVPSRLLHQPGLDPLDSLGSG